MTIRRCWVVAVLVLAMTPATAAADWLFTPHVALPFAGDTLDRMHPAFGAGVGLIDESWFGVEGEVSVAPRFFNGSKADFSGTGSVTTLTGNLLVAMSGDRRVRPYAVAGAGYMRMRVTSDAGTFTTTVNEPGFNAGAGLFAFFSESAALRGEVRYIRSFQNQVPAWTRGVDVDIAPGAFDFWRVGVGLTILVAE